MRYLVLKIQMFWNNIYAEYLSRQIALYCLLCISYICCDFQAEKKKTIHTKPWEETTFAFTKKTIMKMCVSDILWDFQGGKSFISLSKWTRTGSRVANLSNSTIFQVCEISQLNRKINRRRETLLLLNKHRWWQWRWYYNCFRNDDFPSNQTDDDDTSANGLPHIGRWLEWWGDLPMRMCLLTTRWDCSCPSNNKYLWSAHHKIISNTKCLGSS